MKIKTWIKYEESYLPPRCRKLRYKQCEDHVDITLPEVAMSDLRLAFEDNSYNGKGKIYTYKGKLWSQLKMRNYSFAEEYGFTTPLDELMWNRDHCSSYFRGSWDREYGDGSSREAVIKQAKKDMRRYLLVDGVLYEQTAEPRYCINTFGLGHNHGGTGLFVDYSYNHNISKKRYFSALQGAEAVAEANRIAQARGDTDDIGRFKPEIKVYLPELVKVKPNLQHGNGDPFMNKLNEIAESAPDAFTASLICIMETLL